MAFPEIRENVRTPVEAGSNHFEESIASEGLDDELVRQLARLLEMDSERRQVGVRTNDNTNRRQRAHLVIARLCFEAGLSDQAESEARAALGFAAGDEAASMLLAAIHHQRGELGAAIRLHKEMAPRGPIEPSALAELGRLFESSLHPDQTAIRPATINAEPASTPGGMSDLEHAFRLSFTGNLQQALRVVDRVAQRARTEARGLYKLAILERAFLLEQAHDIRGAILTLERLADEPGLASDVERLLCLSMLYEREGTVERIRRALRAVRHAYVVTRRPTLLRRIARLVGKLGHAQLADAFEARYFDVFQQRLHALTLRETVGALRHVYIPPDGLSRLPFDPRAIAHLAARHYDRKRLDHQRRVAILALWTGDDTRAESLFEQLETQGQTTPIDLLYFADVLERRGDMTKALLMRQRAIAGLDKLEAAPLLRLCSTTHVTNEEIRGALKSRARIDEAVRVLQQRHKVCPDDTSTLQALARIAAAGGDMEIAETHEKHARMVKRRAELPRHVVFAAAAFRHGGEVRGIIHELWVDSRRVNKGRGGLDADDVLGSVTSDLRARAVAIFHAVRSFVLARYPHRVVPGLDDRRYFLRITKDDEPSSGDSAGLPIAVAFASVMLGFSVPTNMAFSGALICDAHHVLTIGKIGDVDAKIEGAYERRPCKIILPADNRDDVVFAERIPRKIADETVIFARTFDEVLERLGTMSC
jgi:tetratricopeptide (TPR) repeat protein